MRDLKKQERAAMQAVARRFSAAWERGNDSCDAYVTIAKKRVAVDIRTLKQHGAGQGDGDRPRLRFDKVVTRLMERLRATLSKIVPDAMTVVVTITAPIRLASKTAAALEEKIQTLVGRRSEGRDEKDMIHGNRVRIRLLRNGLDQAPKMIGFVHNSDTDPPLLLNMTRELVELLSEEAGKRAPKHAEDRWLVVISARGSSGLEPYRCIYSQLGMATKFQKILMMFGDGGLESLTE
jgi:hypothetical protein